MDGWRMDGWRSGFFGGVLRVDGYSVCSCSTLVFLVLLFFLYYSFFILQFFYITLFNITLFNITSITLSLLDVREIALHIGFLAWLDCGKEEH